jgi:hypothetical protein
VARANPISVAVAKFAPPQDFGKTVQDVVDKIIEGDKAREEWGNEQNKFLKQRYAVRTKTRTTPWKGASNLNIPMIDKVIRRWKPSIVRLVTDSSPIAHFNPTEAGDVETARTAETVYDWIFKIQMDALDEVVYLADIVAQRGTGYIEVSWDYRTDLVARIVRVQELFPQGLPKLAQKTPLVEDPEEPDLKAIRKALIAEYDLNRNSPDHMGAVNVATELLARGEQAVKIVFRQVVHDRPKIIARDPLQVVLPPREKDPQNADFVCIRDLVSKDDLRKMVADEVLEKAPTMEVIKIIEDRMQQDQPDGAIGLSYPGQIQEEERNTMDELIGILQAHESPEQIEIWKIMCWIDINGDGEKERAILWYHPSSKIIMAKTEYVLPFPRWNIVEFTFEKTHSKRSLSSRGIPQILSPLQVEINRLHNNRLDAAAIQLSPVFLVRSTGNKTRNFRWQPGAGFPVQDPNNDIKPLSQDLRNLGQYLQEEQFTRLIAEESIGIFDSAVGAGDRRTATEVETVQAEISGIFALDAMMWQKSWRDVHRMVFALWRELGEDKVFIRIAGQQAEFQQVPKHEVDKDYDIQPAGTPTNTNKALELNRMREMMQLFWNPFTMQTGAVNMLELIRNFIAAHDSRKIDTLTAQDENALAQNQMVLKAAQELAAAQESGEFASVFGTNDNRVSGQAAGASAR